MKEQIFVLYDAGDLSVGLSSSSSEIHIIFDDNDFPGKSEMEDLIKTLADFYDCQCYLKEEWERIKHEDAQADDYQYKMWLEDKLIEHFGDRGLEFSKNYLKT